ncbi:MAG TPA: endonuclease domain-containing protein [Ignavibacteriaceae bacterium]|nr:endonuclease domain-containing protein [Ignavibacteriaceae bacterium]
MTQHFNKTSEKEKRRKLRKDQTFCEKIMWTYLRDRKTLGYKFRRQYSVDHYVIDFYCPELKLAIELDGSIHDEPDQIEHDKHRQDYLEKFGITFLRITNDELMSNSNIAFKKIEKEINIVEESIK